MACGEPEGGRPAGDLTGVAGGGRAEGGRVPTAAGLGQKLTSQRVREDLPMFEVPAPAFAISEPLTWTQNVSKDRRAERVIDVDDGAAMGRCRARALG